jgi:hypothetical protein
LISTITDFGYPDEKKLLNKTYVCGLDCIATYSETINISALSEERRD